MSERAHSKKREKRSLEGRERAKDSLCTSTLRYRMWDTHTLTIPLAEEWRHLHTMSIRASTSFSFVGHFCARLIFLSFLFFGGTIEWPECALYSLQQIGVFICSLDWAFYDHFFVDWGKNTVRFPGFSLGPIILKNRKHDLTCFPDSVLISYNVSLFVFPMDWECECVCVCCNYN